MMSKTKNHNNITGDKIISKKNSTDYTNNFDGIFRKKKAEIDTQLAEAEVEDFKDSPYYKKYYRSEP